MSVLTVLGTDACASSRPSVGSSRTALVNVDPKSTQSTRLNGRCRASNGALGQRAVEVIDEVLGILDAGGETHEVTGHLQRGPADRCVRHTGGVLDQRLDTTKALTKGPDLGGAADVHRLLLAAPDLEGDHAPEALHLLGRDPVARVTRKPRIVNGGDLAVTKKELDDLLGVVATAVHAHAEGLQAAKHQPVS